MSAKTKRYTAGNAFFLALPILLGSSAVLAQGHLDVTTTVQKEMVVTNENGETETRLIGAETVVPGERVVYTITFENTGADAAENVVITNPIAESLSYVAGSASNGDMRIEFSADGGRTFGIASELTLVDDGIERPATTGDYTHVRWIMQTELDVGAKGSASFAAILE